MTLRRTWLVAVVGFGLPLAGVAAPAQAATTNTSTAQCQTLLTCVVPIVTGLTGTLVTTVPAVVNAVPKIVGSVPATLSNLLGTKHTTPPPSQGHNPPPKPPDHGKPTVKKTHHHTTTPPKAPAAHTTPAPKAPSPTPAVATPRVIPPAPTPRPDPVVQVVQEVAHVAQQVVSLFGWNLLALIPMAGIAFVISRRMAASRRSASGLL